MLYTKPITEILWDDVEAFCQQRVPEGTYLDYKQDFPKHLQKTIAAMANTLGGVILIGVAEDAEGKPVTPVNGSWNPSRLPVLSAYAAHPASPAPRAVNTPSVAAGVAIQGSRGVAVASRASRTQAVTERLPLPPE